MSVDFLSECLKDINNALKRNVPIDALNSEFCLVCSNPECIRSGMNKSKFVYRASNWEELLVKNPKTNNDMQIVKDTIKKWLPVINLNTPEGSSSHDLKDPLVHDAEYTVFSTHHAVHENESPVSGTPQIPQGEDDKVLAPLDDLKVTPPLSHVQPIPPSTTNIPKVKNPFLHSSSQTDARPKSENNEMIMGSDNTFTFG